MYCCAEANLVSFCFFGLEYRPRALGPKPGPRQIAPKKQSLIKQQKMTKVCFLFLFLRSFLGIICLDDGGV